MDCLRWDKSVEILDSSLHSVSSLFDISESKRSVDSVAEELVLGADVVRSLRSFWSSLMFRVSAVTELL